VSLASAGPSAYWYLTRSSGTVALLLLTGAVVLGVLDVRRVSSPRWPRFVLDALHRNVSLLALAFLAVHVLTSVLDSFASISPLDALIPFVGSYRPFWLGLGALALDLLLAVAITSFSRRRMGYRTWHAIHALTYLSWPIALVHGLGTGSDATSTWLLALGGACLAAVLAAVLWRALSGWRERPDVGRAALGGAGAFTVFLAVWLPLGPLGGEWARRAGTPPTLLPHRALAPRARGSGR
jgi:DMSO/TMAO reductase YedYZ heme-binding membrane subunit